MGNVDDALQRRADLVQAWQRLDETAKRAEQDAARLRSLAEEARQEWERSSNSTVSVLLDEYHNAGRERLVAEGQATVLRNVARDLQFGYDLTPERLFEIANELAPRHQHQQYPNE